MELVNEAYKNREPKTDPSTSSWSSRAKSRDENLKPKTENQELKEVLDAIVLLLAPFTPHICEELWEKLGHKGTIFKQPWPKYDSSLIEADTLTIIVQVNGKVRSKVDVPAGIAEEELKNIVLSDEKIQTWIQDKPLKKFIIVPKRLVNIVI